jgi:ABC-type multidrug transport system fused ATPase/permease subunit
VGSCSGGVFGDRLPSRVWNNCFLCKSLTPSRKDKVSEANFGLILQPALSPLLAAVQRYTEQGGIQTGVRSAPDQDRVWVAAFIAVLCIITLTSWDLRASALSGIPVVGLLLVYLGLTRPLKSVKRASHRKPVATGHIIRPLSIRVVVTLLAVLSVEIALFGPPKTPVGGTISLGVAKSLMWYFILQTVCSLTAILLLMLTSVRLSIVPGQ